jgi:cytoskeletal protein RodZ
MPRLGEEFRAAREARRLSLSDVSEQIHIRTVYLQSLEDEDWASIAAPVYVRGFIRTYARFLGLSGEQAVTYFNESIGAQAKAEEQVLAAAKPGRRPSVWLWVAAVAALLLVGFVGYSYYEFQQGGGSDAAGTVPVATAEPSPSAAAAAAVPARVAAAAAPRRSKAHGKRTLQLRVTQASWLMVKIDGTQALEGIFPPGTTKEFHGNKAVIRAGNAGGVDLTVNGRALGSMGPSGAVVDRTIGLVEE